MLNRTLPYQALFLAILLAFGIGSAWALLVLWGCNIGYEMSEPEQYVREHVLVRHDGTPLVVRSTYGEYQMEEYFDLDGGQVEVDEQTFIAISGAYLTLRPTHTRDVSREWPWRIRGINDGGKPPKYWYCIHDGHVAGSAYFVGYDSVSKRPVGFIGENGFTRELPGEANRFPMPLVGDYGIQQALTRSSTGAQEPSASYAEVDQLHFLSGDRVMRLNLTERSISTVWTDDKALQITELDPVVSEGETPLENYERTRPEYDIVLRHQDSIVVVDMQTKTPHTYPIPDDARGNYLTLYRLRDKAILVNAFQPSDGTTSQNHLYWIDAQGAVTRERELLLKSYVWRTSDAPLLAPTTAVVALPIPLAMTVLPTIVVPIVETSRGVSRDSTETRRRVIAEWFPIWLIAHVVSAAMGVYVWRRQRRYDASGGWLWGLLVFGGGVPALLAYLYHRDWPARIACKRCGAETVVNRDRCGACDSELSRPELKGIEVFARCSP